MSIASLSKALNAAQRLGDAGHSIELSYPVQRALDPVERALEKDHTELRVDVTGLEVAERAELLRLLDELLLDVVFIGGGDGAAWGQLSDIRE
jgi:hypothetical protein